MEDTLHYLYTIKLHAPEFDCHIDCGSDGSATNDQDIPSGPKHMPTTEHESIDYQLPSLLSDRLTSLSRHISQRSLF